MPEALLSREPGGASGASGVSLFYTPTFFGRTGRLRCFPHVSRATYVPRGVGVVRVDKAGEAFTRQGAPPPAPRMRRGARTHNNTARPARHLGPSFAP